MSKPHLQMDVSHPIGNLRVACKLDLDRPWTVLFGPSGSGKSTLLKIIAGLIKPQQGSVLVHSQAVAFQPVAKRPVIWAGQHPALFPHMTVRQNLAFGLPDHSVPRQLEQGIEHFNLASLADKAPHQLSGGEQQRVAVVRAALAAHGKTLLLDEPFSGLDFHLRDGLVAALQSWHGPSPIVSVTHSVEEAFLLGAWVVKLNAGAVIAQGLPAQVLAAERQNIVDNLNPAEPAPAPALPHTSPAPS